MSSAVLSTLACVTTRGMATARAEPDEVSCIIPASTCNLQAVIPSVFILGILLLLGLVVSDRLALSENVRCEKQHNLSISPQPAAVGSARAAGVYTCTGQAETTESFRI